MLLFHCFLQLNHHLSFQKVIATQLFALIPTFSWGRNLVRVKVDFDEQGQGAKSLSQVKAQSTYWTHLPGQSVELTSLGKVQMFPHTES